MGRGVRGGGEQSSLGYLFGNGEAPKPTASNGTSTGATSEVPWTENEDRPTTKVHAAPGGRSSLDYLFGGSKK